MMLTYNGKLLHLSAVAVRYNFSSKNRNVTVGSNVESMCARIPATDRSRNRSVCL